MSNSVSCLEKNFNDDCKLVAVGAAECGALEALFGVQKNQCAEVLLSLHRWCLLMKRI